MEDALSARLDRIESVLERFLTAQQQVDGRLQQVEGRLQQLEEGQQTHTAQLVNLKETIDGLDEKVRTAIERLDYHGDNLQEHDQAIWSLKRRLG